MSLHSIPAAGLRTIGQISIRHDAGFHPGQNGLAIAVQLLSSPIQGAPVVDTDGKFMGFISEFDVLSALEAGRELSQLTADELMVKTHVSVSASCTIAEAVKIMKTKHLLVLPVEKDGVVIGCVTRQDLLRAWIGLGLGQNI